MKIGLITIHHANSYGGALQAFATKVVLESYGEARIIDYKSDHLSRTLSLVRINDGPRGILRGAKDIVRLLPRSRLIRKFKEFSRERLGPFAGSSEAFDVAVAGSDQIWNPAVTGRFDSAYFLDQLNTGRKMSFSTSMGAFRFDARQESVVRALLADFEGIAVREADTASYLSGLLDGREVATTGDPTLMLTHQDWKQLLGISETTGGYVLVYSLKEDALMTAVVTAVAKALRLEVVTINQNPTAAYPCDQHIRDAGPVDFVQWFSGASFVVTNSFHGAAFAANFSVPFVSVRPESGANRVKLLLEQLGLSNRFVDDPARVEEVLAHSIDWGTVNTELAQLRNDSAGYLKRRLVGT